MKKTNIEPLVNMNVNPCKMCMPMGAVTAFYGIEKCISILHGSQGCSTYIRRHMATHYNEPVDIASSSLTEQGTVYGGERNLIKGLNNLIRLYHPEVVGVATTCLAETIGEDLPRMIHNFYEEYPEYKEIKIIPVNSPGYGGTQFEGYFRALHSILENVDLQTEKNEKINVILSPMSPKDVRFIRNSFRLFGLDAIIFPDLSDNLDGGFSDKYERLPQKGTSLKDISLMGGAKVTIEISNLNMADSPGRFLEKNYHVPYERINLPAGIRDIDRLYEVLSAISGRPVMESVKEERSRYMDAMVDAHKYNGEGRAVIFGEPDFILATVRLCAENGIFPVVCASGSVNGDLKDIVEKEIEEMAECYHIDRYEIMDDVDFKKIESLAKELKANILIGNSDGRRMEEELKIPLIRRGFPIHDRAGGQRLATLGYEGALQFLDEITNGILSKKETTFRTIIFKEYYKEKDCPEAKIMEYQDFAKAKREELERKTKNHPCFGDCGNGFARIHLPVAPKCNIQCNYCVRKFDCPNESRPGVTSTVLTPMEALEKYKAVKEKVPNLTVVGIAGPGDALANFEETKGTLELIREYDKEVTFCLSTNGLMLPNYANELCDLGVSHVTVTMNAADISIGAQIYKYANYNGMKLEGESAAAVLMANQLSGLRMLVARGIICKVNIVAIKGINDAHIPEIVKQVKDIGCFMTNIMPCIQVKGSAFENLPTICNKELNELRNKCSGTMKQMYHCRQCRADAIGTLDQDISIQFAGCNGIKGKDNKAEAFYRFAVASKSGIIIDQHFGHAKEFYIYEYRQKNVNFIEKRSIHKYCEGFEECGDQENKIQQIMKAIEDCDGVIALRTGEAPKKQMESKGIKVISTYDIIEEAIKKAAVAML